MPARLRHLTALAFTLLLGGSVLVACTGGEDAADAPTPAVTPSATVAPEVTPPPIVSPTPPGIFEGRRTGSPELDAIIEAVETRDMAALSTLIEYQEMGCTRADGQGGPPKCAEGQTEGEVMRVFPGAECHGYWTETATQLLGTFAHRAQGLYSVVGVSGDASLGGEWPAADTLLIFRADWFGEPAAFRLHVAEGRIVASWSGCGPLPPADLAEAGVQGGVTVIAGPWDEPMETAVTVPSVGIAGVDDILDAMARYDVGTLDELAQRGMATVADVPCVDTIMESGEIDCDPKNGDEPGTLVDVFPAAYCHGTVTRDPMPTLRASLDGAPALHSVLHAPEEPSPSAIYQHGDYWLIYEATSPEYPWEAMRLHVSESGELLLVWFGCGPTLRDLVEWAGAPLPRVDVTYVEGGQ